MLRSFDDTFGFEATHRHRNPTGRCPPPAAFAWPAVAAVRMMAAAFCEGLAAHREYEALRSRGITHERALRKRSASAARGCRGKRSRHCISPEGHERRSRPHSTSLAERKISAHALTTCRHQAAGEANKEISAKLARLALI